QNWEFEVTITIDDQQFGKRLYHRWYTRHQFLIPLPLFRGEEREILLNAVPVRNGIPTEDQPNYTIELWLISQPRLWTRLERGAVWVFSTARSGSTWLTNDLLCADLRARPVDEPGIGRMFAPLQWDAERFFDAGTRNSLHREWFCVRDRRKAAPSRRDSCISAIIHQSRFGEPNTEPPQFRLLSRDVAGRDVGACY